MLVEQVTSKRNVSKTLSNGISYLYSWGSLRVTLIMPAENIKHEIHVTLSKEELVGALSKITQREEEINQMNKNRKTLEN